MSRQGPSFLPKGYSVVEVRPCRHHWLLDSPVPGQATAPGTCKNCGESQAFTAWWDSCSWREATILFYHVLTRNGGGAP